jgi:hypothetical protein
MNLSSLCADYINRSPFLREAIAEDLINISALARKIKPEIEAMMKKPVKDGALIMAIKRMAPGPGSYKKITDSIPKMMHDIGDFVVRSGLDNFTLVNSDSVKTRQAQFIAASSGVMNSFYTICNGVTETTFVINSNLSEKFKEIFKGEKIISSNKNLASVTIKLPQNNSDVSGFYYYILKHLAWEGINLVEVVSTSNEFTIVVRMDDIDTTFSVLMRLKKGA